MDVQNKRDVDFRHSQYSTIITQRFQVKFKEYIIRGTRGVDSGVPQGSKLGFGL